MTAVGSGPEFTSTQFRRVMGRFATGVTVVTAEFGGETRGMTASAFMSGSLAPPLCVVSVSKRAGMHAHLIGAGRFAINILAADQEQLARHFGGRPVEGLAVAFTRIGDVPAIGQACAHIAAATTAHHDCGDHTLFVGLILAMDADDRAPLLYHGGRYGSIATTGPLAPLTEYW